MLKLGPIAQEVFKNNLYLDRVKTEFGRGSIQFQEVKL